MDKNLSERHQIEEAYHDELAASEDHFRYHGEYYDYFWDQADRVNDLDVLDYGCGDGWVSVKLAQAGAKRVWGIDISGKLVQKARVLVEDEGLSDKIVFEKMAGENLTFRDESFDLVIGSAILHHTDIALALASIHRVLRSEGKGVFIEPLNLNIFLKIWRTLTPWRRTPTEKALTRKDLELIESVFPNTKFNFFSFTSIFSEGLILLFPKSKLVVYVNRMFEKFDKLLLRVFPFLGKYCAVVVLELQK